jgi:hypothetical protein
MDIRDRRYLGKPRKNLSRLSGFLPDHGGIESGLSRKLLSLKRCGSTTAIVNAHGMWW